jgi:hypothetical protein
MKWNSLMRTGLDMRLLRTACFNYNTPCDCSVTYMGETGRWLGLRIQEHKCNLREVEKSKLDLHTYKRS